jgi:hypothetical protein
MVRKADKHEWEKLPMKIKNDFSEQMEVQVCGFRLDPDLLH